MMRKIFCGMSAPFGFIFLVLLMGVFFAPGFFGSAGSSASLGAQSLFKSRVLIVEQWMEMEPFLDAPGAALGASNSTNEILPPNVASDLGRTQQLASQAAQNLRVLAAEIAGAMIYGYNFSYVPEDVSRSVARQWSIEPIGTVGTTEAALSVVNRDIYDGALYVSFRYDLSDAQVSRAEAWFTANAYPATGTGTGLQDAAEANPRVDARREALSDAMRAAVHARLQLQIPNRPRRVTGVLRLADVPSFSVSGQMYTVTVKLDVVITSIEKYDAF